MGLRYDRALIEQLLQEVRGMKESVTYQAIVEEGVAKGREEGVVKGRMEEARRILFRLGERRIGQAAGASVRSRIESIDSLEVLEGLTDRLLQVRSWEELLADVAAPEPRRGRGKRK